MKNVRFFRYRVCLETIYSLGLRVGEGTRLKICDMGSARMVVHVSNGKGGKERYVPLPRRTLQLLREFRLIHRNQEWLFPRVGRSSHGKHRTDSMCCRRDSARYAATDSFISGVRRS